MCRAESQRAVRRTHPPAHLTRREFRREALVARTGQTDERASAPPSVGRWGVGGTLERAGTTQSAAGPEDMKTGPSVPSVEYLRQHLPHFKSLGTFIYLLFLKFTSNESSTGGLFVDEC